MKKPDTRSNVIRQFVVSCFQGTVNVGDLGKFTAALLVPLAYDEVKYYHAPQSLPAPIPVSDFMASLFGNARKAEMAKYMTLDSKMESLWESGEVFFNHFTKAPRTPDPGMIAKEYRRRTALCLSNRFKGADILNPVNIPDAEVTFCLVQVKNNRKMDHSTPAIRSKARTLIDTAVKATGLPRRHIGIMMCLRHKPPATEPEFDIVLLVGKTPRGSRSNPNPPKAYG